MNLKRLEIIEPELGLFLCSDKESSNLADNILQVKPNDPMEVACSKDEEIERLRVKVSEQEQVIKQQKNTIAKLKNELKSQKSSPKKQSIESNVQDDHEKPSEKELENLSESDEPLIKMKKELNSQKSSQKKRPIQIQDIPPKKRCRESEVKDDPEKSWEKGLSESDDYMNPNEPRESGVQNERKRQVVQVKPHRGLKKYTYVGGYRVKSWRITHFESMKEKISKLVEIMANDEEIIECSGQFATINDCTFVKPEERVSQNVSEQYF